MNQNFIKEKVVNTDFKSISFESMKCILEQMDKNICKIKCKYGGYGTGFFCLIPFPDKLNLLPVLITNNHVLEENDIAQGKIIEFSFSNDKYFYRITIDNLRKKYTNIYYDSTFIEIKKNDGLNINLFLEIDETIYKNNFSKEIYNGKPVYLLHYKYGINVEYSFGKIRNIDNNNIIKHLCETQSGSSGSPILNFLNYKVMGIHAGYDIKEKLNLGIFIKEPIKEFYDNCKNCNNNVNYTIFPKFNSIFNVIQNTPVGLKNVGKSSYMNAVIQCLININNLSNYLLKRYGFFNIDTQPLSASYSALIYKVFNSKVKYITPSIFKEIIGLLNPLFKGDQLADPKDLISFFIEKLHQELSNKSQTKTNEIDLKKLEEYSKNEKKIFELFLKDFILINKSIILDIFWGITRTIMRCCSCNTKKYSFQAFNLKIFKLKKIKEEMKKFGGNINLLDAFNVEEMHKILEGEKMIYCDNCHKLNSFVYQKNICGLPSQLIIILDRGKNNEDFNEEFDFPLIIDFTNLNIVINPQSFKTFYLSGVITSLGYNNNDNHFIAYCRKGPNSPFFCFNDDIVTPVKDEVIFKTEISKNKSQNIIPYILFYSHY